MSNIFKKIISLVVGDSDASKMFNVAKGKNSKKITERELLQRESEIGSKIFGEIPAGHHRDFFCLDEKTWIWHEEWYNAETRKRERMTIRYEVHPNGILKVQEGARYSFVHGEELKNLIAATEAYYKQVAVHVYGKNPISGQSIA